MKITSVEEALSLLQSHHHLFIQGAAATPHALIQGLIQKAGELRHVEIYHLHTEGDAPYTAPEYQDSFHTNALFVGANLRKSVEQGQSDYIPVFLSEIPQLFYKKIIPLDVAFIHVSPPDKHGFCSLGVSVDCTRAAVHCARYVIAQINPGMPRTHGDGLIHVNQIHYGVEVQEPLLEHPPAELSSVEKQIGKHCADLIEDGATLQMGIGAIPDAVLASLTGHQDLGVHTEMFSDGLIPLIEKGIVTGKAKKKHPEKVVSTFVVGTQKLYRFIDDNPQIVLLDVSYVNATEVIRRNPKVTAINSAIEIDLTGQVCADSIGSRQFSGVGGQMDFIRGASLSEGGKPIIALPSVTSRQESRIVPFLKAGAGVVTTRAHVQYIVTEYGSVNLYGKTLRQRAKLLLEIAHPEHRAALEKAAYDRFHCLT
jgi:4-hydroxybutyrate CoA-transferase